MGLVAAWLTVTAVSVLIASAAVGSVRGQVTDAPSPVRTATTSLVASTTAAALDETTTTSTTRASAPPSTPSTMPTSTTSVAGTTESTPEIAPTTTSTTQAPTTTTTTPPPTTPTTTAPAAQLQTYDTLGGSVTLLVGNGTVSLATAVPKPGYSAEEKERDDPSKVEVEFESEDHESKLEARWKDGVFTVDIDEESEED